MHVQVLLTTLHSPLSTRSFHARAGRCVIPDIFNRESIVVPCACGLLAHHSSLSTLLPFLKNFHYGEARVRNGGVGRIGLKGRSVRR